MSQVRPGAATPVLAPWHQLQRLLQNPGLRESPWKGTHNLPLQVEWPRAQPSESRCLCPHREGPMALVLLLWGCCGHLGRVVPGGARQ